MSISADALSPAASEKDEIKEAIERLRAHVTPLVEVRTVAGVFYMRRRNGEDRHRLSVISTSLRRQGVNTMPPALIVAWSLLSSKGEPLFTDIMEGYEFCKTLDASLVDELYEKSLAITGLAERSVEDAEKKS